jgi:hypothetical protein
MPWLRVKPSISIAQYEKGLSTLELPRRQPLAEPRESPQMASENLGHGAPHPDDGDAQKPSWWRRFFGLK